MCMYNMHALAWAIWHIFILIMLSLSCMHDADIHACVSGNSSSTLSWLMNMRERERDTTV